MISTDEIRSYILSFPEVQEVEHWGKPSFRIHNKIFAVFQEDGITLTIKTTGEDKEIYTQIDPSTYQIPDSFSKLNYMNVNINKIDQDEAKVLIQKAWCNVAPKRLVKAFLEGK